MDLAGTGRIFCVFASMGAPERADSITRECLTFARLNQARYFFLQTRPFAYGNPCNRPYDPRHCGWRSHRRASGTLWVRRIPIIFIYY